MSFVFACWQIQISWVGGSTSGWVGKRSRKEEKMVSNRQTWNLWNLWKFHVCKQRRMWREDSNNRTGPTAPPPLKLQILWKEKYSSPHLTNTEKRRRMWGEGSNKRTAGQVSTPTKTSNHPPINWGAVNFIAIVAEYKGGVSRDSLNSLSIQVLLSNFFSSGFNAFSTSNKFKNIISSHCHNR